MNLPCPMDMLQFDVPMDPYLSPYFASDTVLSQFPPVHIVVSILKSILTVPESFYNVFEHY